MGWDQKINETDLVPRSCTDIFRRFPPAGYVGKWREMSGNVGRWRENVGKCREMSGKVGAAPGGGPLGVSGVCGAPGI